MESCKESSENQTIDSNEKDVYDFSKSTLIRVEYPGWVKNLDNAVETLGGLHKIENAIAESKHKLELKFHPKNFFNKGCIADRDSNVGILIKVFPSRNRQVSYDYEVVGTSKINFKFNRMIDYQYLPLVSKEDPEKQDSEIENFYNNLISEKIPNLKWFLKEGGNIPAFFIPPSFSKYDLPQVKFASNSVKLFNSLVRPERVIPNANNKRNTSHKSKETGRAIRVNFFKSNIKIPDQPPIDVMEQIQERTLQKQYCLVKSLFNERPVWRKVAVTHKTGVAHDHIKTVLPSVAYYCLNGPWMACWIKYGYNPLEDLSSRIYQTLDFRIRTSEGTKVKIPPKRSSAHSSIGSFNSYDFNTSLERSYILRPNDIPPARQVFYQYCDILIPEVQDMLSKLPKSLQNVQYDVKNGWLPLSFTEQCREIANKYVIDAVQEELLKEARIKEKVFDEPQTSDSENILSYSSRMLSSIKRGAYQRANVHLLAESSKTINLDDEKIIEVDADEVVRKLPECMSDNSEDGSDLDIDTEVVEEVNKIIYGMSSRSAD